MLGKALLLSSILVLSLISASAAEVESANFIMPGCRAWVSNENPSDPDPELALKIGACWGTIAGFVFEAGIAKRVQNKALFCPPDNATFNQEVRVVVAYIDKHPEQLHESFNLLALTALSIAFPCKD